MAGHACDPANRPWPASSENDPGVLRDHTARQGGIQIANRAMPARCLLLGSLIHELMDDGFRLGKRH